MGQEIINVAKKTLGESRGFRLRGKESRRWNESTQSKIRIKTDCFKVWSRCKMLKHGKSTRKLKMRPRRQ